MNRALCLSRRFGVVDPTCLHRRAAAGALLGALALAATMLGAHTLVRRDSPLVQTIAVGRLPDALVLDSRAGRAFVANDGDATVSVLDLTTAHVLRAVAVGQPGALAPLTLAVDARTHRLFVATPGVNGAPSIVRLLDTHSGTVLTAVRVGPEADALAVDERHGHVLVATGGEGNGQVSLLDARGAVLHTTRVGLAPLALAVDARTARAFIVGTALLPTGEVVGGQVGLVGVIDTRTDALVRTVVVGRAPLAVAVDERTARVFVSNSGDDTVSVLDARTGARLRTVAAGRIPAALAVDARHGRVFVVGEGDGTLSVLNARTGALLQTVTVSSGATSSAVIQSYALAVDEARERVYVTAWGWLDQAGVLTQSGRLVVLDARDGAPLCAMALGVTPRAVAVETSSGRVIVVDSGGTLQAPQGWAERWRQVAAWMPWLGQFMPHPPTVVRVPGSVYMFRPPIPPRL